MAARKGRIMNKVFKSLPVRLLLGVVIGILAGLVANEGLMHVVVTLNYIMGQVISFCVPLIIIGFIAPSITKLGKNASRMLGIALVLAYTSSLGAALFSMAAGYALIPGMSINPAVEGLKELPEVVFQLSIPPVMGVMSALVFSVMIGLAATWTKAVTVTKLLDEFQKIVLDVVKKIIIPILPIYIAFTFCSLAYEGSITKQFPVFVKVIIIVMAGHYLWMTLLYCLGGAYSGKNPVNVVKNYGPAYITAVGTMSSAATLAVALECARKSEPTLRDDMVDFGIPLFANIHLCGSVLTEVFFVMTVSKVLYGTFNHDFILRTAWGFCGRSAGGSGRNGYGLSGSDYGSPWIRRYGNRPDAHHLCASGQLWNSLQRDRRRSAHDDPDRICRAP